MGITPKQESELDRLYQTTLLAKSGERSLLGGRATVVHHFKAGRYNSIRWFVPIGIPLTQTQHTNIHGSGAKFLETRIYKLLGKKWLGSVERQRNIIIKTSDLDYEKIKAHILGERENYV